MDNLKPGDTRELSAQIKDAAERSLPLEIIGQGTRRDIGRPVEALTVLDVSALTGLTSYEPEELVLTAKAGTPLDLIESALAERGQMLAFEPPKLSHLCNETRTGTLGGMLCAGLSGPRRLKAGAVRDFVLGFSAVSGRGDIFKAGGRVVKNVTGYDLSKLMCGSWGTLAILDEVTLKVMPAPETECTLFATVKDHASAQGLMNATLQTSADVSGVAYLPAGMSFGANHGPAVFVRLEGIETSVRARALMLQNDSALKAGERIAEEDSRSLWSAIGDGTLLGPPGDRLIWRLSVPPAQSAAVMGRITQLIDAKYFSDWGGGLLWISAPFAPHAHAETIRAAFASCGGHALLIHAPESVRRSVPVFEPRPRALAELSRRVKQSFDPAGILNPQRMYAGH